MDEHQIRLLAIIVLVASPILFALAATAVVWRTISHRALFLVVSVLALMGIGANVHDVVMSFMWPDRTKLPNSIFEILAITSLLTIIPGFFVLWWLRNALQNSNYSLKRTATG